MTANNSHVDASPHWFELALMTSLTKEVSPADWVGYERSPVEMKSDRTPRLQASSFPANEGKKIVTVTHAVLVRCTETEQLPLARFQLDRPHEIRPGFSMTLAFKKKIPSSPVHFEPDRIGHPWKPDSELRPSPQIGELSFPTWRRLWAYRSTTFPPSHATAARRSRLS